MTNHTPPDRVVRLADLLATTQSRLDSAATWDEATDGRARLGEAFEKGRADILRRATEGTVVTDAASALASVELGHQEGKGYHCPVFCFGYTYTDSVNVMHTPECRWMKARESVDRLRQQAMAELAEIDYELGLTD